MVKFPPGSTVLIPSAIVRHSNCPIADKESRYSITEFSAADLFRWVANGNQNDCDVKQGTREERLKRRHEQLVRWKEGLLLYPTYKDIFGKDLQEESRSA